MSDHHVTKLVGVGPITATAFEQHGITTVGQIAELADGEIQINNLATIIARAKTYLKQHESDETTTENKITFGSVPPLFKTTAEEKKTEEKTTHDEEHRFLITDHSWFEMRVLIPRAEDVNPDQSTLYKLREAIVYELSIEPHERIAFVCSWVETDHEERDKMCTMTYSPQMLLSFNPKLPPLTLSVKPEDFKLLSNRHALSNVLWEVNIINQLQTNHP